jgi:DNA-binding NarL/FixJ family response regulator
MKKTPANAPRSANPPGATNSPAGTKKRVLLVDDHPMMRAGLAQLINKQPDMEVCAEAGSPPEAIAAAGKASPDLVLTDLTMPGRGGLEFIKDLLAVHAETPILVISMHDEAIYAERCLRAGARGYIMKESGSENLLDALRKVLAGQVYVSSKMSERILSNISTPRPRGSSSPIEKLTDREFEVFQLVGRGKSTRDIAKELSLSPKTVDVHRAHIREKLGLDGGATLIRHAVRWLETQDPTA